MGEALLAASTKFMDVKLNGHSHGCEGCLVPKDIRRSIPKQKASRHVKKMDQVFGDLSGSKEMKYMRGGSRVTAFRDMTARFMRTSFLSNMDETPRALETFLSETCTAASVEIVWTDELNSRARTNEAPAVESEPPEQNVEGFAGVSCKTCVA